MGILAVLLVYSAIHHPGRLLLKGENITLISPAPKNASRQAGAPYSTQAMEE